MKTLDELYWELAHANQQWDATSYWARQKSEHDYWLERIKEIHAEIEKCVKETAE